MEKIGLVLSGGGARSICQVGVIKILEKEKFPVDIITGTSMGAIIGSIYALTKNAEYLEELILKFSQSKEIKKIEKSFYRERTSKIKDRIVCIMKDLFFLILDSFKIGIISSNEFQEYITQYLGTDFSFNDTKIQLGIISTNFTTGKVTIFNKGKIVPAVTASSAIPVWITPVEINKEKYIDGGLSSNLGVLANAFLGGEKIVAIENEPCLSFEKPLNSFDVLIQGEKIKSRYTSSLEGSFSDYLIKISLPGVEWFNFSKSKICIKTGEKITLDNLKKIEGVLFSKNFLLIELRKKILEEMKDYFSTGISL